MTTTNKGMSTVHTSTAVKTWGDSSPELAADSFTPAEFSAPLWLRNPHVHTIWGSGEVQLKVLKKAGPKLDYRCAPAACV
jgi:hypothetical protein